jgi:hypothetical protein
VEHLRRLSSRHSFAAAWVVRDDRELHGRRCPWNHLFNTPRRRCCWCYKHLHASAPRVSGSLLP